MRVGPFSMLAFFPMLAVALLVCYIVAWILTMQIVTRIAANKGYPELSGKLWFVGFFGLIFTPALIVAALPKKSN